MLFVLDGRILHSISRFMEVRSYLLTLNTAYRGSFSLREPFEIAVALALNQQPPYIYDLSQKEEEEERVSDMLSRSVISILLALVVILCFEITVSNVVTFGFIALASLNLTKCCNIWIYRFSFSEFDDFSSVCSQNRKIGRGKKKNLYVAFFDRA
jgi:hypothetical protein